MALTHSDADICDSDAVATAIAKHAPSVIVNAAAYTAVDKAESEADRAIQVNRDGAAVLAAEAAKANLPLIHISTDYVFDGSASEPYDEEREVNPQGAYARSKEAGERAVRAAHGKHLILRTAWSMARSAPISSRPCSGSAPSATRFASSTARPGGRPRDLAEAILAIAEAAQIQSSPTGALSLCRRRHRHLARLRHYDLRRSRGIRTKAPRVQPIATAEFPTAAPRPAYYVLSTAKLERIFGIKPRPLRASLKATIERLLGRRDKA